MNTKPILFLFCLIPSIVLAWDPEDDTFDPTVATVIAEGSTRLGDPSPYIRVGYDEFGYTHVGSSIPEQGDPTINLSFIFMPSQDDPAKAVGGSVFLAVKEAEELAEVLEKGADLTKEVKVQKSDWAGLWTLVYEEDKGMIIAQEHNDRKAQLVFSINAAKKLAGALRHEVAKVQDAG